VPIEQSCFRHRHRCPGLTGPGRVTYGHGALRTETFERLALLGAQQRGVHDWRVVALLGVELLLGAELLLELEPVWVALDVVAAAAVDPVVLVGAAAGVVV
jgi:hypothetical protein